MRQTVFVKILLSIGLPIFVTPICFLSEAYSPGTSPRKLMKETTILNLLKS
ncbi:hypothetical protein LEP1GSC043_1118 [Leptospira weilii str. Ecochallenge]|uniref:Uncharacterized protein n=1 Tax=Leptospira weilii str. Ecochallenge TaxID=1049986 RepID=N1UC26_9LEPT|nr:hypothetical protein LEP1GSC051_2852 [Leptospira sp. P2653]EMY15756.1 hypothetical protein LEP1GSC043_1118 [Leptospira weilii str. Ecochallenge]